MTKARPTAILRPAGIAATVALAGVFLAVAGSVSWMLLTASGAGFVLRSALGAVGGSADGIEGRLVGPLSVGRLRVDTPALGLRAEGIQLEWSLARLLDGELRVERLHVATLDVETPPSDAPVRAPATLAPPMRIAVAQASLGRLRVTSRGEAGDGLVLRELAVSGSGDFSAWSVTSAKAVTPFGEVQFAGRLAAAAPFAIDAKGGLAGRRNGTEYRVAATAAGVLGAIEVGFTGTGNGLSGEGSARLQPFERLPLRRLVAHFEGIDLSAFAAAPKTRFAVEADLAPVEGALLAGALKVENGLAGPWDADRLPVRSLAASLRVEGERVELRAAELQLAGGGAARGGATWADGKLEAKVDVKDVDLIALHSSLRATRLAGTLGAVVTGESQSFRVALADPRLEVAGEATIAAGTLTVEKARLTRGAAVAQLRGTLALGGERAFAVEGRVAHLDPSAFAKVPAGDLNGEFAAKGRIGKRRVGEARVVLADSRYANLPAQARLQLALDGDRLTAVDVDAALGDSRLVAKGALGAAGDALDLRLAATDLASLGHVFGIEVGGRVNLEARLAGSIASPEIRGAVDASALRLPGGLRVASIAGKLEVGAGESGIATGDLGLQGLSRQGDKAALLASASLSLKGTRAAHELRLEAAQPDQSRLRALFDGGLVAGERGPEWRGRLESLDTTGTAVLALAAPAPLVVSAERIELRDAVIAGEPGEARLALTRWTPDGVEARGTSQGVFLRSVTRLLGLQGQIGSSLVMAGQWDLRLGESPDGFVELRRVRGDVRLGEPRRALGLESLALRAEARGGRVRASLDLRGKQAGSWAGEISAAVRRGERGWEVSPEAPLDGRFTVDVPDLAWTAAWIGPEALAGGNLKGSGTLGGTARDPRWRGRLEAAALRLRDPASGAEVDEGTVVLALDNREARVERFTLSTAWRPDGESAKAIRAAGRPASGEFTAEGAVDLGTRKGSLTVRARQFPLTRLATRFLAVTGEGRADFDGAATTLSGSVRADAGWFGVPASAPPSLSDDVIVVRGQQPAAAGAGGPVRVDLRVDLGDDLHFRGRGLVTRLAGQLRLAGDAGPNLRATGNIRAVGGTYDAYGRTLVIERGALNFLGPVDNPGLNVLALRKGLAVEAGVEITGTVSRPKARLVSFPDVPEPEKLSWLVLGRGRGEVSAADAATLIGAANEILGQGALPGSKIVGGLGIDEIRVGQAGEGTLGALPESTVAGKTGSASAAEVISVGKRLSDNLYVSYRQGLADAEGSLRVAWQFTKSVQLILQAGDRPGVDAAYRFSLEDVPKMFP